MERQPLSNGSETAGTLSALQKLLPEATSTRGTPGADPDKSSNLCSRHRQLWTWFLESHDHMRQSEQLASAQSTSTLTAMQTEILADLLRKCTESPHNEHCQDEAKMMYKEKLETWRKYIRDAVEDAWDEAKILNAVMSDRQKHLTEGIEQREQEDGSVDPDSNESLSDQLELLVDELALPDVSEKQRSDRKCRQEKQDRVKCWVQEQQKYVGAQRRARTHVKLAVPGDLARTWRDQLSEQARRERNAFLSRHPRAAAPSGRPRRYPWEDYLRDKSAASLPSANNARP